MSQLTYKKNLTGFSGPRYHIYNGSSGDFNKDGKPDIAFTADVQSASSDILGYVRTYVFDTRNNKFELFPLSIDGAPNSYPQVYFGMYTVVTDINSDGISDIIPIDQSERPQSGPNAVGHFIGAPQYAYLSTGIGIYEKKSMAEGNLCVHGWGAIQSADGKFRFVFNTPWVDQRKNGIATVITAYDKSTNKFEASYFDRNSKFYTVNNEEYTEYFYQSAVDVNNDGNTDIIAFSTPQGKNSIFLNDGHGGFHFFKHFSTGLIPHIDVEEITFGDFNSDGYQDFVVLGVNRVDWPTPTHFKTLRVLINDKGNGFVDQSSTWLGGKFQNVDSSMGYLDTYDVNLDGKSDFSYSSWPSQNYYEGVSENVEMFISEGQRFQNFSFLNEIDRWNIPLDHNSLVDDDGSIFTFYSDLKSNAQLVANVPTRLYGNFSEYIQNTSSSTYRVFSSPSISLWIDKSKSRFAFDDKTVALDTSGIAGQAYRIYKAGFDRTPDTAGLGYWIAQMDKGMDVVSVAARFIDSSEFRSLYGHNPTDAEFLTKVYSNVLARTPDAAGLAWWVNEMKTNPSKTWQKVLADFSESIENQANVASLIANGIEYAPWTG
jgi:hypothetical protein